MTFIGYLLGGLAAAMYSIGCMWTFDQFIEEAVEVDLANQDAGRDMPFWWVLVVVNWSLAMAMFWPAYWTGRALMAPAERLLLPPGESA